MGSPFIVLSHREPYQAVDGGPELKLKTNGVFRTLDAVMRRRRGTWIAWREAEPGEDFAPRVMVPGAGRQDAYTVRRIGLPPEEARRFYYGFTSTALWPVLFSFLDRARFMNESWETYRRVNEAFAAAACEEADEGALIWINDFHLMLVPRLIKERRPDITIALFLHTSFPPPDVFSVIPWREELLECLLHLDLIGFHIPSYALNFANTAERLLGAEPAEPTTAVVPPGRPAVAVGRYPGVLRWRGREIELGAFPVGVDAEHIDELAAAPATRARRDELRRQIGTELLLLSAERLDYVKGVIERLEAFERLLARDERWHGRVSFVQIAVPTRTGMDEFQDMRRQTEEAVGRINGRFATLGWQPVHHFYTSFPLDELVAFYTAADVVWVTPLRDGLNLVAKEYVASRRDGDGVVVLSEFAGAAAGLDGVVLTNPYSPEDMDRALESALGMDPAERRRRMAALRSQVMENDVRQWARRFLGTAERIAAGRTMPALP